MHPTRSSIALVLAAACLPVTACGGGSSGAEIAQPEPAKVEAVAGSEFKRLTLTTRAAERLDIRTVAVSDGAGEGGRQKSVPYAALIYDPAGGTFTYTSPAPLVFLRAPVTVEAIEGDVALLSAGPDAGMKVVTVGAAELYGEELGVGH